MSHGTTSSYYSNAVKRPILDIGEKDRFELDPSFLSEFDGQEPEWGPVGKFTFKRTYARPVSENTPDTEEFWQGINLLTISDYKLIPGTNPRTVILERVRL